jgi:maltose/maltodextrin transport system permease protein
MAIVRSKNNRLKKIAAHLFLLVLCSVVMFPLLVVLSVSFRAGNFASGSLIPTSFSLEHWKFVLGFAYPGPDGQLIKPDLPVLIWLWNSVKVATLSGLAVLLYHSGLRISAHAVSRSQASVRRIVANANVSSCAGVGGHLCHF